MIYNNQPLTENKIMYKSSSFEILDYLMAPIIKKQSSLIFNIIVGTILGCIVGIIFLVFSDYLNHLHQSC